MIVIIIPNWNGLDFIADCLASLEDQTMRSEIIVADNGSTDGSLELIKRDFPKVTIVELGTNHGFAGGVNAGIQAAIKRGAKSVALFNNDAVADPDWLKQLQSSLDSHHQAGIVTSKIITMDGSALDSTGDFYSRWGLPFPRGRGETNTGKYDQPEMVFGASGGASLYRVAMLEAIGLFDEDFFAYYEDTDLSFRAQLAGWEVWYEPKALARHHIGGTSTKVAGLARFHSMKNLYYVYTKNMPGWLYWKYLPRFWFTMILVSVNSLRTGQIKPQLKAWGVALTKFPRMLAKRRRVQSLRTVDAKTIDAILYHGLPPTQQKTIQQLAHFPVFKKLPKRGR